MYWARSICGTCLAQRRSWRHGREGHAHEAVTAAHPIQVQARPRVCTGHILNVQKFVLGTSYICLYWQVLYVEPVASRREAGGMDARAARTRRSEACGERST